MFRFKALSTVLPTLLIACGAGDSGTGFTIEGRVVDGPDRVSGVPGVTVRCPRAGVQTVSDAEGYFTMDASLPENEQGETLRLAVWFDKEGVASVSKTMRAVKGVGNTVVAVLNRPLTMNSTPVPTAGSSGAVSVGNATYTLFHDSIQGDDGLSISGSVDVAGATWEPILTDTATVPTFPAVLPSGGASEYVTSLVVTRFSVFADGKPSKVGGSQGMGLSMTSVNPLDTPIGDGDDRLFHVDPSTGELVEKPSTHLDTDNNILLASMDAIGTWVWARDVNKPTCVDVTVSIAGGKAVLGSHVRLVDTHGLVYDEQIGAPGGVNCLRGPVGHNAEIVALLAGPDGIRVATQNVLLGGEGSCVAGCPASFTLEIPCGSDAECHDGSTCVSGKCNAAGG